MKKTKTTGTTVAAGAAGSRRRFVQGGLGALSTLAVGALVIETAFGDDERALAGISQHLCPSALGAELAQLHTATDVYITHIKPGEVDAVMSEIGSQDSPHRIRALATGDVMRLPS